MFTGAGDIRWLSGIFCEGDTFFEICEKLRYFNIALVGALNDFQYLIS